MLVLLAVTCLRVCEVIVTMRFTYSILSVLLTFAIRLLYSGALIIKPDIGQFW